jgi:hypothetical protein
MNRHDNDVIIEYIIVPFIQISILTVASCYQAVSEPNFDAPYLILG